MSDYDLTGMAAPAAKEFVIAAITALTQTRAKRENLEKELALWEKRVDLARDNDRSDLQAQAETRVFDIREDLERIMAEERDLAAGVRKMKAQLAVIQSTPQMSVDADRLAAELEMLVGERDDLAERFEEEEAEQALRRLKGELEGGEPDSESKV